MASVNLISVDGPRPRPSEDLDDELNTILKSNSRTTRYINETYLDNNGVNIGPHRTQRRSSSAGVSHPTASTSSRIQALTSHRHSFLRPASASDYTIGSSDYDADTSSLSGNVSPVDRAEASSSSSRSHPYALRSLSSLPRVDSIRPQLEQSFRPEDQKRLQSLLKEIQWLENYLKGKSNFSPRTSNNPVHYLNSMQAGNQRLQKISFEKTYGTKHLVQNKLFKETKFDLGTHNKVFCSQWLNDRQVVMGTKCNDILIVDVKSGRLDKIPSLQSSGRYKQQQNPNPESPPCGIHAVEINPSRTLIATGASNTNEVAIYKLPTFDPICVGEAGHTDWIFDLKWLDDEFLITGSRDSTLALWRVDDDLIQDASEKFKHSTFQNILVDGERSPEGDVSNCCIPSSQMIYMDPLQIKECKDGQKIRATVFNSHQQDIVALTLNSKLHVFDACTLEQKVSVELPTVQENVCLAQDMVRGLYGVGSKSHVSLFDSREMSFTKKIPSICSHSGIRSLNFMNDLLTIGTGHGLVLFYDLRMHKNVVDSIGNRTYLQSSAGYVNFDDHFNEAFHTNMSYSPAIYTHTFDTSGIKLFAAGGPLPASVSGNYAGLWS